MTTIRPLGPISDFVAEGHLARALETPKSLPTEVNRLLANLYNGTMSPKDITEDDKHPAWHAIARLDATMIEMGVAHSGFFPSPDLAALVNSLSGMEPPILKYDDLIFANPPDDLRMFMRGELGDVEREFYRQQFLSDAAIGRAATRVQAALGAFAKSEPEAAADALEGVRQDLREAILALKETGKIYEEQFAVIRVYWKTHPIRNLKGPSGAFSSNMPTLELLLWGDKTLPLHESYLRDNWLYFPTIGRPGLTDAITRSTNATTLVALWRANGRCEALKQHIRDIGNFCNAFRAAHYRVAAKVIPKAISNETPGTSQPEPGKFLRMRMEKFKFREEEL